MQLASLENTKLAYTVREAVTATGISRSRFFLAARNKELTMKRAGRENVIETPELVRFVQSLPVANSQAAA